MGGGFGALWIFGWATGAIRSSLIAGMAGIGGGGPRPRWKLAWGDDTVDIAASDLKNLLARFRKFMTGTHKAVSLLMRQYVELGNWKACSVLTSLGLADATLTLTLEDFDYQSTAKLKKIEARLVVRPG